MKRLLTKLTRQLKPLVHGEGIRSTALAGVKLMHTQHRVPRAPITYEPKIVIIAQGEKIGYFGSERITYGAGRYLVMSVPLPFECETHGSVKEPLYGLSISLSPRLVTSMIMQMKRRPTIAGHAEIMRSEEVTIELLEASIRLAKALTSPEETALLGSAIVREIVYRVLTGPLQESVMALALPPAHFGPVQQAVQLIAIDYALPHTVANLAGAVGLSPSTFHQRFREIMRVSPLQYLKQTRLHKARLLMVHDGLTASAAAARVGYQSGTQFSREFRRHFGGGPAEVAKTLRAQRVRLEE